MMATKRAIRETIPAAGNPMANILIPRSLNDSRSQNALNNTPGGCTGECVANCSPLEPASVLKTDLAVFYFGHVQ